MGVKKIFTVLITIVACVLIGALVLNFLLPNAATGLVDTSEDMIFKATGIAFDFAGDGHKAAANANGTAITATQASGAGTTKGAVTGFK